MITTAKKICVIGDFAVGKTSLINRYIDQSFNPQYRSTVGIKISKKCIAIPECHTQTTLMIWDVEGSTTFKSIDHTYFQGAAGAILVGDLTRPNTLEHLASHAQHFLQVNPQGKLVIALNKMDCLDRPQLIQLKDRYTLRHVPQWLATYPTSAKDHRNVEQIFQQLAIGLIHSPQLILA